MSSTGHRAARRAELAPQAVDDAVEADPARRLDQHDVAVAQARRQRVEGRLGVAARGWIAAGSSPAATAPSAIAAGAGADDDEPVDGPGRGLADRAMALVASPRPARASRRAPRRAGRAARPAGRARRRPSRGEAL